MPRRHFRSWYTEQARAVVSAPAPWSGCQGDRSTAALGQVARAYPLVEDYGGRARLSCVARWIHKTVTPGTGGDRARRGAESAAIRPLRRTPRDSSDPQEEEPGAEPGGVACEDAVITGRPAPSRKWSPRCKERSILVPLSQAMTTGRVSGAGRSGAVVNMPTLP